MGKLMAELDRRLQEGKTTQKLRWISASVGDTIKVFPIAVLPYLIWRRQWAATAGMVVFLGIFLFVVPAPVPVTVRDLSWSVVSSPRGTGIALNSPTKDRSASCSMTCGSRPTCRSGCR